MYKPDLVLIAASIGGPEALKVMIPKLKKNLGVPVIVVQHMLEGYTSKLAASLDDISELPVKETNEYESIEKSKVYLAKAGVHTKLIGDSNSIFPRIAFSNEPKVNFVRPSADVLFKDVADKYKHKNILVVIGTGMGKDGMLGIENLKSQCNCYCITERENDCVVYGMPRVINEHGLADEKVALNAIGDRINMICTKGWS